MSVIGVSGGGGDVGYLSPGVIQSIVLQVILKATAPVFLGIWKVKGWICAYSFSFLPSVRIIFTSCPSLPPSTPTLLSGSFWDWFYPPNKRSRNAYLRLWSIARYSGPEMTQESMVTVSLTNQIPWTNLFNPGTFPESSLPTQISWYHHLAWRANK